MDRFDIFLKTPNHQKLTYDFWAVPNESIQTDSLFEYCGEVYRILKVGKVVSRSVNVGSVMKNSVRFSAIKVI